MLNGKAFLLAHEAGEFHPIFSLESYWPSRVCLHWGSSRGCSSNGLMEQHAQFSGSKLPNFIYVGFIRGILAVIHILVLLKEVTPLLIAYSCFGWLPALSHGLYCITKYLLGKHLAIRCIEEFLLSLL